MSNFWGAVQFSDGLLCNKDIFIFERNNKLQITEADFDQAWRVICVMQAAAVSGDLTVVVRMTCHLKKSGITEN